LSHAHVYATLFYGEYDPESRVLTYVNAGHNAPSIARRDADGVRILRLESEGLPVGLFPDAVYEERRFRLHQGEVFVAYKDGITEASCRGSELWGPARLEAALAECTGMQSADVVSAILEARERFTGALIAEDDTTLVVAC
jgi:phosphoserine phosphatase RsbU/P